MSVLKVVLPRGSMTFSKNEIWTGYFTSSAKNILEKVRNWNLCVFLLLIVWKTMIFQHKTIPKSMGKSMKSWFFTKIHQKLGRFQKNIFSTDFFTFYKNFHGKNFDIMSMQICLSFRFLVFLALVDIYEKRYRVGGKINFFPTVLPLGSTTLTVRSILVSFCILMDFVC